MMSRLRGDAAGACVGALTTLPQAVAYGLIAVSPLGPEWAVFGITASVGSAILFCAIIGALNSNPFLICGPRAVTALVVATAIAEAIQRGHDAETAVIIGFASVVVGGLAQAMLGIMRLGRSVAYMPAPVLGGFVTASALLVFVNSLPMAVDIPGSTPGDLVRGDIMDASLWAVGVSCLTIAVNFIAEGRVRVLPAALVGLLVGALAYHLGVGLGNLPQGPLVGFIDMTAFFSMPMVFAVDIPWDALRTDIDIPILAGLSLSLLTSFDTVLSAVSLDAQTGDDSKPNQDLCVHGLTNGLMGVLGFLPGSGTLARSMAAKRAGAVTRMANIGTSLVFAGSLIFLAPLIAELPLWVTAGMLIATAIQAIDRTTVIKLVAIIRRNNVYRRVLAGDVLVTLCVVIVALIVDLIAAIGVGMLLAVILFVLGMGRSPVRRSVSGARFRSKVERPVEQVDCLEREGHRIGIAELQGALFFGTTARLLDECKKLIAGGAEYIILDFRYLTSIDSTGSTALRNINILCREAGGHLILSCVERERRFDLGLRRAKETPAQRKTLGPGYTPRWVWLNMDANGVIDALGESAIFDDTDTALAYCEDALLRRLGRTGERGRRGIIASSPFLDGISRQDILKLGPYVRRHRFSRDQSIFEQNDEGSSAYFLVHGRTEVLLNIPGSSRRRRVSVLTEGALFGEMGLLDGAPRSASVIATKPSICFSISKDDFRRLEKSEPAMALRLMRNLNVQFATRLRIANIMISELEQ